MTVDQQNSEITIQFTPEQQRLIYRLTGFARPSLSFSRLETVALSLAAVAARSEVLPVSTSAATIQQMLGPTHEHSSYFLQIQLTDQQQEKLKSVTKISHSSLVLAPDEWNLSYHETWQNKSNEIRIGRKIKIVYGENRNSVSEDACVIALPLDQPNSSGVFGTGRHPSTQLSLELLESNIKKGDRVMDVGTGSGILAVAAARLGAREVLAVDTDPAAVAKARLVVGTNNLEDVIELKLGGVESADGLYDVLVANIFVHVIISLAPALCRAVRPLGKLIVSGIVSARANDVIKGMRRAGFELDEQRSQDVWQGLVFTRMEGGARC